MAKITTAAQDLAAKIEKAILDEIRVPVTDEIQKIYDGVIDMFYDDYTPKYYYRTDGLRLATSAADGFGVNYGRVNNDDSIIGIMIGGEYIKPYLGISPYRDFHGNSSKDLSIKVVDNVISRGRHGNISVNINGRLGVPTMSPPPKSYLSNDGVNSLIKTFAKEKSFNVGDRHIIGLDILVQNALAAIKTKGVR